MKKSDEEDRGKQDFPLTGPGTEAAASRVLVRSGKESNKKKRGNADSEEGKWAEDRGKGDSKHSMPPRRSGRRGLRKRVTNKENCRPIENVVSDSTLARGRPVNKF